MQNGNVIPCNFQQSQGIRNLLQTFSDENTKRTLEERILTSPIKISSPPLLLLRRILIRLSSIRWKDLSEGSIQNSVEGSIKNSKINIPMPSCLSRKQPEERIVPDMIFISYTIEARDPKFETRLWNQPFYINLDGLEVCLEDPIMIPWTSILL